MHPGVATIPLMAQTFRPVVRQWMLGVCVLLLVGLVYVQSLGNDFVTWDDEYLVYLNPWLRAITPKTLWHLFTTFDPHLYVPLTLLTYQVEVAAFDIQPFSFHLVNLLLHLLNVFLVFHVINGLVGNRFAAAAAALLWGVHPLNAETVLWISARKDLLSTFFFLLSMICYLQYRASDTKSEVRSPKSYVWSIVLFLLALLSKVSAVVLPAILLLLDWRDGKRGWGPIRRTLPFFALSAVFGGIAVFGKRGSLSFLSTIEVAVLWCVSTAVYLHKIVWPVPLSILYPYEGPIDPFRRDAAIAVMGILLLLFGSVLARRWTKDILLGVLWFLLALLPIFATFSKGPTVNLAADHYAYLPLIGIALCAAAAGSLLLRNVHRRSPAIVSSLSIILIAAFFLFFAMRTLERTHVWRESRGLYIDALQHFPRNILLHYNLALAHAGAGDREAALREFDSVLALDPRHGDTLASKGFLLMQLGRRSDAWDTLQAALRANPAHPEANNNVGVFLLDEGNAERAIPHFEAALRSKPSFMLAAQNLSAALGKLGRYEEGLEAYQKARALDPILFPGGSQK